MATWPGSLPSKPLKDGFNETLPSPKRIRSAMGNGKEKVRRRTSSGPGKFTVVYELTASQADTLETFYETDTKHGTLVFTADHPRTGVTMTDKFRFIDPPALVPVGEGYRATLQLEMLP